MQFGFFPVSCSVQFTYVEKYPDEAPLFEITTSEELEDCEEDITTVINQTVTTLLKVLYTRG